MEFSNDSNNFDNPKQSFINQKEILEITKIKKKIPIIQKNSYSTNITYLTHNDKIYKFFSRKTHLIEVLGLGSPTTNLWIQPLESRSVTVELFLSSSRTPSQAKWTTIGRPNGHPKFRRNTSLTVATNPLFCHFSPFLFFFLKTHFILFLLIYQPPQVYNPISKNPLN